MPTNEGKVTHIAEVEHPALKAKWKSTEMTEIDNATYYEETGKMNDRIQYLVFPGRLADDIGTLLFMINCTSNFFIFKYLDYRREQILERIRLQELEKQRNKSMKTKETDLA